MKRVICLLLVGLIVSSASAGEGAERLGRLEERGQAHVVRVPAVDDQVGLEMAAGLEQALVFLEALLEIHFGHKPYTE